MPVYPFDQSHRKYSIFGKLTSSSESVALVTPPETFGELKKWLADNNIESTDIAPTDYKSSIKYKYDDGVQRECSRAPLETFKYPCIANAPGVLVNGNNIQKMLDLTSKMLHVDVPTQEQRSEHAAVPKVGAL